MAPAFDCSRSTTFAPTRRPKDATVLLTLKDTVFQHTTRETPKRENTPRTKYAVIAAGRTSHQERRKHQIPDFFKFNDLMTSRLLPLSICTEYSELPSHDKQEKKPQDQNSKQPLLRPKIAPRYSISHYELWTFTNQSTNTNIPPRTWYVIYLVATLASSKSIYQKSPRCSFPYIRVVQYPWVPFSHGVHRGDIVSLWWCLLTKLIGRWGLTRLVFLCCFALWPYR